MGDFKVVITNRKYAVSSNYRSVLDCKVICRGVAWDFMSMFQGIEFLIGDTDVVLFPRNNNMV